MDTFTKLDRCDRCGAQALVSYGKKDKGELMFCKHDATSNEEFLIMSGWKVISDNRESLIGA